MVHDLHKPEHSPCVVKEGLTSHACAHIRNEQRTWLGAVPMPVSPSASGGWNGRMPSSRSAWATQQDPSLKMKFRTGWAAAQWESTAFRVGTWVAP